MASLRQIATHLGISHQAVAKDLLKMGIANYKTMSIDEVRLAYLERLRNVAAKTGGLDVSLTTAKTQRELREIELLDLKIAKEREEVVDMKQLLPVMEAIWQGCKTKILGRSSKLKTKLDALYGIDIDIELLEEEDEGLLDDLSGYVSSYRQNHSGLDGSVETAKEDNND